jgi:hypothetical protein
MTDVGVHYFAKLRKKCLRDVGPRKFAPPDRSRGKLVRLCARAQIWWFELYASLGWRLAAWRRWANPGGGNRQRHQLLLRSRNANKDGEAKKPPPLPASLMGFMAGGVEAEPVELLPPPPPLLLRRQPYARMPAQSPAIGMHSTARDVGKLMQMLLNHGSFKKREIMAPATVACGFAHHWSPHPSLPGETLLGMTEMYHGVKRLLVCEGSEPSSGSSSVRQLP